MDFIIRPNDVEAENLMGGKARALSRLQRAGFNVPPFFVVSPAAFEASLSASQREILDKTIDSAPIDALVGSVELSEEVRRELMQAVADLCPNGERVAVRSSASDEDGAEFSFAGQLASFLFVSPERVADKVAAVWCSGFSERLLAYRREHGLSLLPHAPSALVQRMIDAEVSGVAFGADPVTGRRGVAVVSALYGLGAALVSGECDADTYRVNREGRIIERTMANKHKAHRFDPGSEEGVSSVAVSESAARNPALRDDQVLAVATLVRRANRCLSRPQDIEWAIEHGELHLLQSRPITSLTQTADPDGLYRLWDNSNIVESYSGVTTPLTFSFARRAYEEVYRQFCRIMRVPSATIAEHDNTFRNMLGLIRGRVYYNLLNWYRVLAMLPGFAMNRRFMEQMMGVREGLPDEIVAELSRASQLERLRDSVRLAGTIGGLLMNFILLPRKIRKFYRRLDDALTGMPVALEDMRADELVEYYHDLERNLLTRWDAPLVNDFFAMIFYGALKRLTEKWCGDTEGTLQNDLLSGEGGMISAEPAERVRAMAKMVADNRELVALLRSGALESILQVLEALPIFKSHYHAYLDKFGERCPEELKLESQTLHDNPLPLFRVIGNCAASQPSEATSQQAGKRGLRSRGEQRVREALASHPARRLLFNWILRNARARVRDRENLRFERTRVFGRVRRIFVESGRRLHADGWLDEPRDVFYLSVDEVLGFVEGTATCTNLKGLAALRKEEFEGFREGPALDDRFETRGVVYQGNPFQYPQHVEEGPQDFRKGIGCCPGVVRGPVRVITDPRDADLRERAILVAERTDPGWILLFPAADGLLVERGSLLSHSAIVARELGIPAIVSIPGVTQWLSEGGWVELDGSSGIVRKVPPRSVGAAGGA